MADITFVVHSEWLESIKGLPLEQQDKIIAEIVRYGANCKLEYESDAGIASVVNLLKGRIDFSKNKYAQKIEAGKVGGRKKKVDDDEILRLAREGNTSAQIAEILGISKSAVDHSEGWKKRKEKSIENWDKFVF